MIDPTNAVVGKDAQDKLVTAEDVKAVPQEQMAESVHGAEAPPPDRDTGNAGRVPQEMMSESAGGKDAG